MLEQSKFTNIRASFTSGNDTSDIRQ